jgi:uroporphyrin-III C-methyltransferase
MGRHHEESAVSEESDKVEAKAAAPPPRPDKAGAAERPPAQAEPPPQPTAAPRRGGGIAWLALLVALGALGWQWWLTRAEAPALAPPQDLGLIDEHLELLETRMQALEAELARLVQEQGSLRNRLSDSERIHRSLREEVLGVGERAGLLEDAVARLAERRLEGQAALRLDEAESLLRLAYERQRLVQDRDGALAALRVADATLAAIDSPQLVNLRQTLRREIAELAAVPQIDHAALSRRLDDLRGLVARLPEAPDDAPEGEPDDAAAALLDRLGAALSRVVSVRRIGPEAELERFPSEARRASLMLEIALLRASLAATDTEGWQRGTERLGLLLATGFDSASPLLASAREIVSELGAARLVSAAPAPEQTLRELRNLRAMRSLVRDPAPVAAPADVATDIDDDPEPAGTDDGNGDGDGDGDDVDDDGDDSDDEDSA